MTAKQDNVSRDEVLKRMLKMKPKPHGNQNVKTKPVAVKERARLGADKVRSGT